MNCAGNRGPAPRAALRVVDVLVVILLAWYGFGLLAGVVLAGINLANRPKWRRGAGKQVQTRGVAGVADHADAAPRDAGRGQEHERRAAS